MTKLNWGDTSARIFETGLDHGVLYPKTPAPANTIAAKNYITNPRFKDTNGALTTLSTNLALDPSLEVSAYYGTAASGEYPVTNDTSVMFVGARSKRVDRGATALTNEIGQVNMTPRLVTATDRVVVAPGDVISASVRVRNGVSGGRARCDIYFFDSSSNVVSVLLGAYVNTTQNVWTEAKNENATAPAGTAYLMVRAVASLAVGLTAVGGEQSWFDAILIQKASTVTNYFDGDTADDATYTYDWTGTANASTSTKKAKIPTGATGTSREVARNLVTNPSLEVDISGWAVSGNCSLARSTATAYVGSASLSMTAITAANMFCLMQWATGRAPVTPGATVTASVMLKAATTGRSCSLTLYWYDAGGTQISFVGGSAINDNTTAWTKATVSAVAPANAATCTVVVAVISPAASEVHYVDAGKIEQGTSPSEYFDGNTLADDKYIYSWTGAANASASIKTSVERPWLDASVPSPVTGDPSARMDCNGLYALQGFWTPTTTIAELTAGATFSGQVKVKAPVGFAYLVNLSSLGAGAVQASGVQIGTGDWQTITFTGAILGASLNPYIVVRSNTAQAGTFWVCDAMTVLSSEVPDYFDGSIVFGAQPEFTYAWEGVADNSFSTKTRHYSTAVPWVGLTSVDENGAEGAMAYYVDGRPYLYVPKPKEYSATLKAYTYPDEFAAIMGLTEAADGMYLDSQQGDAFDLSYRTLIGNQIEGSDFGYKIHLVYNATVSPAGNSYSSVGSSINPSEFSWDIQAVPSLISGYRATAHVIIDTRHMDPNKLAAIESLLYGDSVTIPAMPDAQTVFDLLSFGDTIVITDNGDGTWTAEGSYHNIYLIGDGVFEIDNVNAVDHGDGTYDISSTP